MMNIMAPSFHYPNEKDDIMKRARWCCFWRLFPTTTEETAIIVVRLANNKEEIRKQPLTTQKFRLRDVVWFLLLNLNKKCSCYI